MRGVLILILLSGCGAEAVRQRAANVGRLDGVVTQGAVVFAERCARCHGALGEGTTQGIPLGGHFLDHSIEEAASFIISGVGQMPPQPTLSDQELADVIAFGRARLR